MKEYDAVPLLFYSNVTGIEVPTRNIQAACRPLAGYDPRKPRVPTRREWPWAKTHPASA
jgi:hypothetical protein